MAGSPLPTGKTREAPETPPDDADIPQGDRPERPQRPQGGEGIQSEPSLSFILTEENKSFSGVSDAEAQ